MKTSRLVRPVLAGVLLSLLAAPAMAHPGHNISGFGAGLVHPFAIDHMMIMVGVGLWSVWALPQGRQWRGPACFVMAMIIGSVLGLANVQWTGIEAAIACTLIGFGALFARGERTPVGVGLALVSVCGLLHGYAHGSEAPASAGFAEFVAGFAVTTAVLHACGAAGGIVLNRWREPLRRVVAVLMAATGAALLLLG